MLADCLPFGSSTPRHRFNTLFGCASHSDVDKTAALVHLFCQLFKTRDPRACRVPTWTTVVLVSGGASNRVLDGLSSINVTLGASASRTLLDKAAEWGDLSLLSLRAKAAKERGDLVGVCVCIVPPGKKPPMIGIVSRGKQGLLFTPRGDTRPIHKRRSVAFDPKRVDHFVLGSGKLNRAQIEEARKVDFEFAYGECAVCGQEDDIGASAEGSTWWAGCSKCPNWIHQRCDIRAQCKVNWVCECSGIIAQSAVWCIHCHCDRPSQAQPATPEGYACPQCRNPPPGPELIQVDDADRAVRGADGGVQSSR